MITITKEYWSNIPVLHVVDQQKKEEALPTLTYIHGITSAKEHNLPIAYLLAEKGYRVILPDCMHHGEREENISSEALQMQFFDIVKQNLDDIETIYEHLVMNELVEVDRFGLAGTSMGGITTAAALTQFSWVTCAGILMGTPKLTLFAKDMIEKMKASVPNFPVPDEQITLLLEELTEIDLSVQKDKIFGRPIFFWHGEKDDVVPFAHSYDFYEEIIPDYKNPENIHFLKEINRGHKVSRLAIVEFTNWLEYKL
ncbi:prolyl oligopeptidase family serine peptidase [Gracilibacillus marinus]|uniref:Prolyl oligopeptidase family serine peptidase n=1 Tax=Gracilibacillus marinus TaxID=630535 RepID=A0ABV8VTG8_9BACI